MKSRVAGTIKVVAICEVKVESDVTESDVPREAVARTDCGDMGQQTQASVILCQGNQGTTPGHCDIYDVGTRYLPGSSRRHEFCDIAFHPNAQILFVCPSVTS